MADWRDTMYMSYCKFEGTLHELRSCLSTVEEHINGEAEYPVSDEEIRHFRDMVETFVNFIQDNGLLDDDGYLYEKRLDKVCKDMARGSDDDDSYEDEEGD